ncbi:MAG: hypothetical protein OEY56_14890 [Cyclobacteriaceae bacterium]|nr:hypothetical protein [Cyclobacteriaceae bacterium]
MRYLNFLLPLLFLPLLRAGAQPSGEAFGTYWYRGLAEINSYQLHQSRYGEIHEGTAVLIFVTEPFSLSNHVKKEQAGQEENDQVTVLKLNFTKNFITGIYPYSMMMSSFVPVSYDTYPDVLKVSATSQEWCGHTFTQINLGNGSYTFREFSYFEHEGDRTLSFENFWLEDELWQRIRIDPASLPTGAIRVFPGLLYHRLSHENPEMKTAVATLRSYAKGSYSPIPYQSYTLSYANRRLVIYFEREAPYRILGWEEEYEGKTTWGKLVQSINEPYWHQHHNEHRALRETLGLGFN